ncbi:unnamed protein product [Effrenium voratum]|nr:unnamed protein product [Effrenium voratum]
MAAWCLGLLVALAYGEVLYGLPGMANYELVGAYEELVATLSNLAPLGLQDLPQRLILFSAWYVASRTLYSALEGRDCSCHEPVENLSQVPAALRTRICKLDAGAIETVSPFLFGDEAPDVDLLPPELWALIAKRAMYLGELTRTHRSLQTDPELESSMMSLAQLASSMPELGAAWMTGRPPRVVLPHCSSDDFHGAFWWEGVSSPSSELWLFELLGRLEESSRMVVALRPAPYYMLVEERCEVSAEIPLLHDPSRCLQDVGGWDVVTMIDDLQNITSVGSVQGRVPDSPGNDTFVLEYDEEGKVTSKKYGKVVLSPKMGGRVAMLPKTADLVVVSPQAGNCFDVADMIPPGGRGNAFLLVVPINPLYAPPTRVMPDYTRIRFELHFIAEDITDNHKLQRLLFLAHCSLQSAVDLLAPRYVLLFVDGARAIFAEQSVAHRYCTPVSGGESCAPLETLWRRGAACSPMTLHLMRAGAHVLEEAASLAESAWPCEDYKSLELPEVASHQIDKKIPSKRELYAENLDFCAGLIPELEVRDPASWPHVPGRQHLLGNRGHCLIEEGFCECFPPWRGPACDQPDLPRVEGPPQGEGSGTIIVTMASMARLHELHFGLANWWENFNHRFDHPVLIFHQGLSPSQVANIRGASANRIWFANVDRFFVEPQLPLGPGRLLQTSLRKSYRLMCRFKATFVLDQAALQGFEWMLWLDSDSYFTGPVEVDLAEELAQNGAIFGFTHVGREDPPVIKNLFDAALLFEAAELGGSKDRPPAALSEDEGGVPNFLRAFEEGFSPPATNTYYERMLSINSPLDRGHVLPFGSPAWKGWVPLTDLMILQIPAFNNDALRRFTDWIDEWGGWWLYRWGDAAIRAVQVWLMLEAKECYEFSKLPYAHQHFCRCGHPDQNCTFLGRGAKIFRWSCES